MNQMKYPENIIINFRKYVNIPKNLNVCWLWEGGKTHNGYGVFSIKYSQYQQTFRAHRFMWEYYFGPIPSDKILRHKCDNPSCVNPNHLELGSHQDNSNDMVERNRQNPVRGSDVGTSKLTDVQVLEILTILLTSSIVNINVLCHEYEIESHTIHRILKRETWKHLTIGFQDSILKHMKLKLDKNKLNKKVVDEIKNDLKNGIKKKSIALKYGISYTMVYYISNGTYWNNQG